MLTDSLGDFLVDLSAALRRPNPDLSAALYMLGTNFGRLRQTEDFFRPCDCGGEMAIKDGLPLQGCDRKMGSRAIMVCLRCGEMEVR